MTKELTVPPSIWIAPDDPSFWNDEGGVKGLIEYVPKVSALAMTRCSHCGISGLPATLGDPCTCCHKGVLEEDAAQTDHYIAWCRYRVGSIETCDSDAEGAFTIYRAPVISDRNSILDQAIAKAREMKMVFPPPMPRSGSGSHWEALKEQAAEHNATIEATVTVLESLKSEK